MDSLATNRSRTMGLTSVLGLSEQLYCEAAQSFQAVALRINRGDLGVNGLAVVESRACSTY
jgi:hypothetical protein